MRAAPSKATRRLYGVPLPTLEEIEDELSFRYLKHFIRRFWPVIETDTYMPNWHIDAICDHLQAVADGRIKRLLINVPPRTSKSLTVSVFFPAWAWLHYPDKKWLFSSYAYMLSLRDSLRCRRLLDHPMYHRLQAKYQPGLTFSAAGSKERYANSAGGYRLATSVGGSLTGEGGDIIVVDDPHNVIETESTTIRENVTLWWDESMSTRLNNPDTGAYIVIMQRVHELDLAGHILAKPGDRWDHLCIPAEYEGDRIVSSLDFCDPRTIQGESMWPERLTPAVLAQYKAEMTEYAYAGQFQQRPAPREGGLFKVDKLLMLDAIRDQDIVGKVRYWDKAGTQGGGAATAGVLMGKLSNGTYAILDVVRGHWEAGERERQIKACAERDGHGTTIYIEQEPGSGGKESAQYTVRNLAGFRIRPDRPTGDKATRAEPFADQVYSGNVCILKRGWTKAYMDELRSFPRGRFRDQVDASSGAFLKLASMSRGVVMMS